MTRISFTIAIIVIFGNMSCQQVNKIPVDVQQIINNSSNANELKSVIEHYNANEDSLKLKAAYFLIRNLDGRYYYQSELLTNYLDYIKLIRADRKRGAYFMNSFLDLYGPLYVEESDKRFDLEEVASEQLITDIDIAFKTWREQPWGKDISFELFCNYILPFRINDEIPEYNREEIYIKYNKFLSPVIKSKGDAVEACKALNTALNEPQWILSNKMSAFPNFSASRLIKYRVGACRDMADLAIFTMRAAGIPVTTDFVPQWPYRSSSHSWNVVFDKYGKAHTFLGAEDSPGTPHKPFTKKGKVFRNKFTRNPQSLAMLKDSGDIIPAFLLNPRIKDVTDEYVKCFNISIPLAQAKTPEKFAYLCVFNNRKWMPVDWGKVTGNNTVEFNKAEGGIVYLAGYYNRDGLIPASPPFLLKSDGTVKFLMADLPGIYSNMTFDRIFPVIPDWFLVHDLVGGVFEGANRADFIDAVPLGSISEKPFPFWNELTVRINKKFRYVRYKSPLPQHCFMGEMEFWSGERKLQGELIRKDGLPDDDPSRSFDKAMDGDPSTFFDARFQNVVWFGMDLQTAEEIEKIRFSPAFKDKGSIAEGHLYDLFYWDKDKHWVLAGTETASSTKVSFNTVPPNALYRLSDKTEKTDARIFTYENGVQVWW